MKELLQYLPAWRQVVQSFRCQMLNRHDYGPPIKREYPPHAIIEFHECVPCGNRRLIKVHALNKHEAQAAVDLMWEDE